DNSDDEDGFRIYRNGSRIATVGSNVTSYTHKNLNSETRYCYEVVAYNESGESGTSNRNCAVTKVSIPEVPGNVKAKALSPSRITITWRDDSENEDGFRIYRDGSRIATVGSNVTSYTDTGLEAGRSYSYAVTAFNDSGESGIARTVSMKAMEAEQEPEQEPEREEPKEEEPGLTQAQLLAGIGIVLMVMGYIFEISG
ncbi:MAG: fibronectin type III domain-containing protein, partial [Candidatus Acetothermia bacterium]